MIHSIYNCLRLCSGLIHSFQNIYSVSVHIHNKLFITICSWVFDESLRNKDYLAHIFEVMTFGNNNCLLWCKGHNEIIFYPLSERYAAIEYFANAFFERIIAVFTLFGVKFYIITKNYLVKILHFF